MEFRHGQGATEYLMIFAAVLLVAITAVVVLGFFPAFAGDATISTSNTYWRNEARPFAILDSSGVADNGTFYLGVENAEGVETLTVTNIVLGNSGAGNGGKSSLDPAFIGTSFGPGESRIMPVIGGPAGTAGDLYEVNVTIYYTNKNGIPATEYGDKNLAGRYV